MTADVASSLASWSTTESSNSPSGSTALSTNLDDNLRMIQAVVRTLASSDTIASASTTDLSTKSATFLTVSGTTGITAFGTVSAGVYKFLYFSGSSLTITHNGTSLISPTGADISVVQNDVLLVLSLGSGNWRVMGHWYANPSSRTQTLTNKTVNLTSNTLSGTKAQFDSALSDDNFAYAGTANTFSTNQLISVNSASNALEIRQIGAGNALVIEDNTNPDSSPFVIDASGQVVIGHTANMSGTQLEVINSITRYTFADTAYAGALSQRKSRSATIGGRTIVQSGDELGNLYFYGDDGAADIISARISAYVDGTPGTNDMPGRLVIFTTADGASSPTERLRIDSAGAVKVAGDTLILATSKTPASAGATGVAGQIAWDANYVYVCVATNTWKRAAISTW